MTLTRSEDSQGRSLITAEGEIDLSNTGAFASALADVEGPLVVDLTGVTYVDSAGMSVLFAEAERLEIIVTPLLGPLLEISGITSMATIKGLE